MSTTTWFSIFKNKSHKEITQPLLTLESSSSQNFSDVRVFTFSELVKATKNFSGRLSIKKNDPPVSALYKGVVQCTKNPGVTINVAIRKLDERESKEWEKEVNVLKRLQHPNVIKLVGYCAEDKKRFLVYECIPNSLQDHLSNRFQRPLTWVTRLKIAQEVASGLLYLSEAMDSRAVHENFKSLNILLDDQLNAKLDIGLAAMGDLDEFFSFSMICTRYQAPEFAMGRITSKSIVWNYGVFLYELITGCKAYDSNRRGEERDILSWVRPHLSNIENFKMIVDPRLQGNYSLESALEIAVISEKCLLKDQIARPQISEVLEMVKCAVEVKENENDQIRMKNLINTLRRYKRN